MKCPKCGEEIPETNRFCPNCGEKNPYFRDAKTTANSAEASSTKKSTADKTTDPQFQTMNFETKQQKPPKQKGGSLSVIIGIIGLLFCATPVGIVISIFGIVAGVLDKKKGKSGKKPIFGIAISILALLAAFGSIGSKGKTSTNTESTNVNVESTSSTSDSTASQTTSSIPTTSSTSAPAFDMSQGMEKYQSGQYAYITASDLDQYAANMAGVNVYTVVTVEDKDDTNKALQTNHGSGYMFTDFKVVDGSYDAIAENSVVAVLGTVDAMQDLVVTKTIQLKDCYVFAVNTDAQQYQKPQSDDSLSQYFHGTEATADAKGDDSLSEADYKALCQTYPYEDILRNPDSYYDKYCVVTGTADQTIDSTLGLSTTIYVKDADGNKWGCVYSYSSGESRILEGDNVTFYGKLKGTANTTTVLGKQITLPEVDIKYLR